MKIFAKRTKKKASSESTSPPQTRTVNKSDPIVEDLLKKDPSEWNAKERRMVKRYQMRKDEDSDENKIEGEKNHVVTHSSVPEGSNKDDETIEGKERLEEEKSRHDDSRSCSVDDSANSSTSDEVKSKHGDRNDEDEVEPEREQDGADIDMDGSAKDFENSADAITITNEDSTVDRERSVLKLLDQLNSKQKRTLSRKLERLGASVLGEVEQEAKELLGLTSTPTDGPTESGKRRHDEIDEADPTKVDSSSVALSSSKNKKRKKEVDWSSLTAEERLRREEQRRLQEEAAQRRSKGDDATKAGHKHPLNSQRRRANRRKPKWKKTTIGSKNEHNSSGFIMRKHSGQEVMPQDSIQSSN